MTVNLLSVFEIVNMEIESWCVGFTRTIFCIAIFGYELQDVELALDYGYIGDIYVGVFQKCLWWIIMSFVASNGEIFVEITPFLHPERIWNFQVPTPFIAVG